MLSRSKAKLFFALCAAAAVLLYAAAYAIASLSAEAFYAGPQMEGVADSASLWINVIIVVWLVAMAGATFFSHAFLPEGDLRGMALIVPLMIVATFALWFPIGHFVACAFYNSCL